MGMWEQARAPTRRCSPPANCERKPGWSRARWFMAAKSPGPGYCNQRGHIFLATDLTQGETDREVSEQDMITRNSPLPISRHNWGENDPGSNDHLRFGLLRVKG